MTSFPDLPLLTSRVIELIIKLHSCHRPQSHKHTHLNDYDHSIDISLALHPIGSHTQGRILCSMMSCFRIPIVIQVKRFRHFVQQKTQKTAINLKLLKLIHF